jgi:hypothetical protein
MTTAHKAGTGSPPCQDQYQPADLGQERPEEQPRHVEFERYVTHAHMKIRAPTRGERRSTPTPPPPPAQAWPPAPSPTFNDLLGGPYYPAGSIALEAYPHWRQTFIGPIPTVIGAVKYGAKTDPAMKVVAVMSADAPAHGLMIAKSAYDEVASDPATKLAVSSDSSRVLPGC